MNITGKTVSDRKKAAKNDQHQLGRCCRGQQLRYPRVFELCRQIGCETYINGNMGSGTVQEMSEWVEYMTFDGVSPMADLRAENGHEKPWTVDFFGIGNENWGCGGNMNPEFYGNMYRRLIRPLYA